MAGFICFKIFRVLLLLKLVEKVQICWLQAALHSPHFTAEGCGCWIHVLASTLALFVEMRMVLRLVESSYVIVVDAFAEGGYWDCLAVELCCRSAVPDIRWLAIAGMQMSLVAISILSSVFLMAGSHTLGVLAFVLVAAATGYEELDRVLLLIVVDGAGDAAGLSLFVVLIE
ncbi:hypothetical protein Nepgr_017358 [Nepenthes gracilis]|uniref:Uncharacterized protein n=1 Tax=Nepenthes gracilis TaxID=150966 RepID=A0AAD3SR16_NEPGR|nr:hypothetical protein Nepgr_017358 [Nepenthes gracilis]